MKTRNIFLFATLALAAVSCNDMLDMTPTDSVSSKTMWESTRNAEYSINHLYSYIWSYNAYPTAMGLTEALTDELKYTSYNFNSMAYIPSYISYFESTVTAQTIDVYLGMWGSLYVAVRETNEALSYLKTYGRMNDGDKTRLEAELRFLRGYFYFELARRYKDVILYDEDLSSITKDKAVTPEDEVWDFIQADLAFAAENLPAQAAANGRIDKGMAFALTSRAMLYAERWDSVIAAANEVEALGYALEPRYADACGKPLSAGNREAILQYSFDITNSTASAVLAASAFQPSVFQVTLSSAMFRARSPVFQIPLSVAFFRVTTQVVLLLLLSSAVYSRKVAFALKLSFARAWWNNVGTPLAPETAL